MLVAGVVVKIVVAALVLALAAFIAFPSSRRVARFGQRWALQWHVLVPSEVVPAFDARTRLSHRLAGFGVALCGLAIAAGLFDSPGPGPFLVAFMSVLTAFLLWRVARGMPVLRAAGAQRVARPRATRFSDYMPVWTLAVVAVSAAGPLAFLAFRHDDVSTAVLAAAVLQAVTGTLTVLLLSRIGQASMPAADETQLYLQDADRASAMCHVVLVSAWSYLVLMQQIELGDGGTATGSVLGDVTIQFAPLFAYVVVRAVAQRRFRRRLWPDQDPAWPARAERPIDGIAR